MSRTIPRAAALAAAALAFAGCAFRAGLAPQEPPPESDSARRIAAGPHRVASLDVELLDAHRNTPARGSSTGEKGRRLRTRLWFPERLAGKHPLVVFAHGFHTSRKGASYLTEHLASHGYVVAAPDFPRTRVGTSGGLDLGDVVNQPRDLSFVIDSLLAPDGPVGRLAGRLDPERVAAVGFSLGGLTATLLAFHTELGDPRLRAVVSIAGPSSVFTERFFRAPDLPFLIVAGTMDAIVPYAEHAAPLLSRAPTAELVTIDGASHVGFEGIASSVLRFYGNPDSLGCWAMAFYLDRIREGENPIAPLLDPDEGIEMPGDDGSCRRVSSPAARPRRQQLVAMLAVRAFLDRELASSARDRDEAGRYLATDMPTELREVRYERAGPTGGGLPTRDTRVGAGVRAHRD